MQNLQSIINARRKRLEKIQSEMPDLEEWRRIRTGLGKLFRLLDMPGAPDCDDISYVYQLRHSEKPLMWREWCKARHINPGPDVCPQTHEDAL